MHMVKMGYNKKTTTTTQLCQCPCSLVFTFFWK